MTQYEDRLVQWNQLRADNQSNNVETALLAINDWWQMLPLDLHYLHWDDIDRWPDPWELLSDGIFCSTAKALGIAYTLDFVNRKDIDDIQFAQTAENDSLVIINQGKYILNWAPGELLNTRTLLATITQCIDAGVVLEKFK